MANGKEYMKEERKYMLILRVVGIAGLLCSAVLYCCIIVGKRSDDEDRRLWEMKISEEQKEERN